MYVETLFLGLLVSTLLVELIGVYPGGIIVPGYLALYLGQPLRLVGTLIISLLALLSYNLLSRFFILYGRRRFVMMITLGAVWTMVWYRVLPGYLPMSLELRAIGWVIPGLLANTFEKQKILPTIGAMAVATGMTYALIQLILTI